jgi:hypothetical protein
MWQQGSAEAWVVCCVEGAGQAREAAQNGQEGEEGEEGEERKGARSNTCWVVAHVATADAVIAVTAIATAVAEEAVALSIQGHHPVLSNTSNDNISNDRALLPVSASNGRALLPGSASSASQ